MNFPDTALFSILYRFINTPGIGGLIVVLLGVSMLTSVVLMLRWIGRGANRDELDEYAYPTPALHQHH